MIPQDPTLFAGPLRYSLDPAGNFADAVLWNALESVDMKSHVENMGGLEAEIAEAGENLSAGQRQLLCMARALLESPKLLIMDEVSFQAPIARLLCRVGMLRPLSFVE